MQPLRLTLLVAVAALLPGAWAAVRVKGIPASGAAPGTLSLSGPDPNQYAVAFTSYLATPSTQAAENFAPMPWRTRTVVDDPSNQATLDREQIPGVVNTQLVDPWVQTDAAARVAFPGIAVADEDRAAVRPPNPSLCVGNGYVLEASDMVLKVWDASGKLLAGPVSLTDFFGQSVTGRFSDAFCVFDGADTQRFYITVANYALAGGQHLSSSQLLVAVSATANPAEGFVGPFRVPTMGLDEGGQVLHALGGCRSPNPGALPDGCLAAGPLVGIDQHGLWVGVNLYQINSANVGGNYTAPLLLGISKQSLLGAKHATPAHAAFSGWDADTSFSLAPSLTQGGSAHCTLNNGTVFVASSGPSMAVLAGPSNTLLTWAITNTSALSRPGFPRSGDLPAVAGAQALASLAYADPTAAGVVVTQPDGGVALDQQDSRLTQLSYSGGMLWAAATTAVLINRQGTPLNGAIYWAIQAGFGGGKYAAKIASQGYVSVMGNHIVDPVVTPSSASGTPSGVLAAALVGPDYHMSPAWTPINMQLGAGAIHTPVVSKAALTGPSGDNSAATLLHGRSAATTDSNGLAWVASEWAAGSPTQYCQNSQLLSYQTSCVNWGTYITAVSAGTWP